MTPDFQNTEIAFQSMDDRELYRAFMLFSSMRWPLLVKFGTRAVQVAFSMKLPVKKIIRATLFSHFCGGETIAGTLEKRNKLGSYGIGAVLDYSVEGKEEEKDFNATCKEILRTIRASEGQPLPFAVFKVTGIARFSLLEKVTKAQALTGSEEREWERVRARVRSLCQDAVDSDVNLLIDAEETWVQGAVDQLAEEMMQVFNKKKGRIFHTLQMYRHDRLPYFEKLLECCKKDQWFLAVKVVRGAYMEKEREKADTEGQESPIYPDKEATDQAYDRALELCLGNKDRVTLFAGTHNEASCMKLVRLLQHRGQEDAEVIFSQLLGMSDHLSFNLASCGYKVSKYVPYGPVQEALPYLFRRAEENTSIKGQAGRELSLISHEIRRRRESCKKS